MEKKVGKLTLFLLFFVSLVHAVDPSVVVSIQDVDNNPIKQVMLSSQFILQITVNNINSNQDISYIEGMDKFQYSSAGRSSNVSIYNGQTVSKIIYKFNMKADNKGVYSLGPVTLTDISGKDFHSNKLSVVVGDELITSHKKSTVEKYIATSTVDKKTVYVGEKIVLNVDFLDGVGIDQYALAVPEFDNLTITNIQQNLQRRLQHENGQEYVSTQWIIDAYPKKPEFTVIEGLKIRYLDSHVNNDFFGRSFFGGGFASLINFEQELNIRPVGLEVLELPKQQGFENVSAVGNFSDFIISINKNSIEQGKGLIVTAKIVGNGNFEMIDSLSLVLPDDCHYYNSESAQLNKKRTDKIFEYIIQAESAGEYHIQPQLFHYFDPISQQYKTLRSNSIEFSVTPSEKEPQVHDIDDLHVLDEDTLKVDGMVTIIDDSIDKVEALHVYKPIIIPIIWYNLLLYLLYSILFLIFFYRYTIKKYIIGNYKIYHFIIFFKAKRACNIAAKNNNTVVLYSIFMNLFMQLKVFHVGRIHHEMIDQYIKNKKVSDSLVEEWNIFYNKISQASFSQFNQKNNKQLFQEALIWLERLRE